VTQAEVIQYAPGGMVTIQDATGSSTTTVASGQTSGTTGNIVITLVGQTITVNWFGTVITGTIPSTANTNNTFIGFNPNGSQGNSNDWTMTVSSMTVSFTGIIPSAVACNGIVQSDGTCGTVAPNQGVAVDANGHTTTLPEVGYSTDAKGNTTIAWEEDRSRGIYDPRRPIYWVNNSMTDPGSAANLATQVACDMVMGKISGAEVRYPQGLFYWDNLQIPPGTWWHGVPASIGGTTIHDAYNGRQVAIAPPSVTVTCSDGQSHTFSGSGTKVTDLTFFGCGEGGCGTAPGGASTFTLFSTSNLLDLGLDMQSSTGMVQDIFTQHFSGFGLRVSGQDAKAYRIRSYADNTGYLFGSYNGTNDTTGPGGTGWHGSVEFLGADNQVDGVEVYGFFDTPTTGNYLHVADIITGGGLSHFDHLWAQLGQVGIAQPYGLGNNNIIENFRVDFARIYGIWVTDLGVTYHGGLIDGSCTGGSAVLALNTDQFLGGDCEQFFSGGVGTTLDDVTFMDNPGFGATVKTADIYLGYGQYFNLHGASFEKVPGVAYGENINFQPQVFQTVSVTGATPSVDQMQSIYPADTAATTITGFMNVMKTQAFYVLGGNANDIIQNNANIATCGGQDINLGTTVGFLMFKATGGQLYGRPAAVAQVCGGGGGTVNGSYLPLTGGTLTGALTLSADPTAALQAATKNYVDTATNLLLPKAGGTLTGPLVLNGDPTTALQAATKNYVDTATNLLLPKAGGALTGPLTLAADPAAALQAATKQYVDTATNLLLPKAGGTLTGPLVLNANPTTALQAATKQYVDNAVAAVTPTTTTTQQILGTQVTSAGTPDKICTATGSISGTVACGGVVGTPVSVTVATKLNSPILNNVGVTNSVAHYGLTVNSTANTQILVPTTIGSFDQAMSFKREMWYRDDQNLAGLDNWELDSFNFDKADQWMFMMGWQCNRHNTGFWQYDNFKHGWVNTSVACNIISGHTYHMVLTMHRDPVTATGCTVPAYSYVNSGGTTVNVASAPGPCEYFDTFQLDDLTAGTTNTYTLNAKLNAEPANMGGWTTWDGVGSQVQLDVVDSAASSSNQQLVSMWVDDDVLTAYNTVTSTGGTTTTTSGTTGNLGSYNFDSTAGIPTTVTGTPTIDNTIAYTSPASAQFNAATEYYTVPLSANATTLYGRAYMNISTIGTAGTDEFADFYSSTGALILTLYLNTSNGVLSFYNQASAMGAA
jgi:hypothetical protein